MANPVLLRVRRGGIVESVHRGALAAWHRGAIVFRLGDTEGRVFLRSSAKPFQALGFVLSGAADAFGVTEEELAVACASQGGEPVHVRAVLSMMAKGGIDPSALRCGVHPPAATRASFDLVREGQAPEVVHNNCSGKHTAMVLTAKHLGASLEDYLRPDHPVQEANRRNLALFAGIPPEAIGHAVDGCSAPAWTLPLEAAAAAFGRLGAPDAGIPPAEAAAARRIVSAMTRHPHMVAGAGRGDTALMRAAGGRVLSKLGAEGVQGLAVPALALGIALKADDGGDRLRIPLAVAVLRQAGVLSEEEAAAVGPSGDTVMRNHRGLLVGELEAVLPRGARSLAAIRNGHLAGPGGTR